MRFAVVGAGAIGAFIGGLLAKAGEDVTLIARGDHLRAMQERGLRVHGEIGEFTVKPTVTDDPNVVGTVDVLLLTVKAHSLAAISPRLAPLLGPDTSIVSAQNGIPWWYFYCHGGELEGIHLETVDPGGMIAQKLDPRRAIGCVIYCSTIITEPGVIEQIEGRRFAIGEPDGSKTDRCQRISEAFIRSGLRCPIRRDIRHDIWVKLMGSVAFNPISALTRATLIEIVQCQDTRDLASKIMAEAEEIAKRLAVRLGVTIEQRLSGAQKVGHHKTSMLQDLEAGRPLELDPIMGAVVELGEKLGSSIHYTKAIYACVELLAQTSGRATALLAKI
jgi:2-dehydropantoate 2-reductase